MEACMEDLRQQMQNQYITTVGDTAVWTISLDKGSLFTETSARSMYFIKLNSKEQVTSDSPVILDDDRGLFDIYMETAVQELLVILSRRIPQRTSEYKELFGDSSYSDSAIYNDTSMLEVSLVMSSNHDNNLITALNVACKEYLIKRVLEQWYSNDFGSSSEMDKVAHILHFRRKSAARRVRPLL